ncbi:MAG: hypothetical protein LBP56_00165 [Odoribacteraceae bacterium]|nr:hypothetical protein [Odoribacteraceae bacterium]
MKKEDLMKIIQCLPRGYGRIIMERTGLSLPTIYNTIHGKSKNELVISTAIELAKETKEKSDNIKSLIESL